MLAAATTLRDGARWSRVTALDDLLQVMGSNASRTITAYLALSAQAQLTWMSIIRMCISVCRTSSSVKHCKTYLIVPVP